MLQGEPKKKNVSVPLTLVSCFDSGFVLFMVWGIFFFLKKIFLASISFFGVYNLHKEKNRSLKILSDEF